MYVNLKSDAFHIGSTGFQTEVLLMGPTSAEMKGASAVLRTGTESLTKDTIFREQDKVHRQGQRLKPSWYIHKKKIPSVALRLVGFMAVL